MAIIFGIFQYRANTTNGAFLNTSILIGQEIWGIQGQHLEVPVKKASAITLLCDQTRNRAQALLVLKSGYRQLIKLIDSTSALPALLK